MVTQIDNIDDVRSFMLQLVTEGTNAHPDEDFNNYVSMETEETTYTEEEAEVRNNLMGQCFVVCKQSEANIYDLMQEVFLKETGMDRFIPVP